MSNFKGIMKEYPFLAADYFKGKCIEPAVSAYFLSHCHRDHMEGLSSPELFEKLKSRKDIHLYCTPASACLLRNDKKYKHLDPYLVSVEYDEPTLLSVASPLSSEVSEIVVTFLPAGHCVGSAMILLEGLSGTVLYTGDFRIAVGDIKAFEHLHTESNQVKQLKSVYLDTTFCRPAAFYIPSRTDSLKSCVNIIQPWLEQSPKNSVAIICPAQYGYEHLFLGLHKVLGMKVYVGVKKYAKYEGLPEVQSALTTDASETRIALTIKYDPSEPWNGGPDDSDNNNSPKKNVGQVLKIKLSAMWYTRFASISEISRCLNDNFYRVCYSTHSSLQELQDVVAYLQPENIYPNVIGSDSADQMIKWLQTLGDPHTNIEDDTNDEEEDDPKADLQDQSQDYVPLGKLNFNINGTGDEKQNHCDSSSNLDFGSSPNKPENQENVNEPLTGEIRSLNDSLQNNENSEGEDEELEEDREKDSNTEGELGVESNQLFQSEEGSEGSILDSQSGDENESESLHNVSAVNDTTKKVSSNHLDLPHTTMEQKTGDESSSPKWCLELTPSDKIEIDSSAHNANQSSKHLEGDHEHLVESSNILSEKCNSRSSSLDLVEPPNILSEEYDVRSSSPDSHLDSTKLNNRSRTVFSTSNMVAELEDVPVGNLHDSDSLTGPEISEIPVSQHQDCSTIHNSPKCDSRKEIDVITYNSDGDDSSLISSSSEIDIETVTHKESDVNINPIITYPEDDSASADKNIPVEADDKSSDSTSVLNVDSNNVSSIIRLRSDLSSFNSNCAHPVQTGRQNIIDLSDDIEVIHEVTVNNHISGIIGSSSQIFHFNVVSQGTGPKVLFDAPSTSTTHTVLTTESNFSVLKRSSSLDVLPRNSIKRRNCYMEEQYEQSCIMLDCPQTSLSGVQSQLPLGMLQTNYEHSNLNVSSENSSSCDLYSNNGSEVDNGDSAYASHMDNQVHETKRSDSRSSSDVLCLTNSSSEDLDVVGNGSSQLNCSDSCSKDSIELIELDNESDSSFHNSGSHTGIARNAESKEENINISELSSGSPYLQSNTSCIGDSDVTPDKIVINNDRGDIRRIVPRKIFKEDPSLIEVITIDD